MTSASLNIGYRTPIEPPIVNIDEPAMLDIQWNDKFSVGHERIDHEHQVFLDLIRNVAYAADHHFPQERITRLLEEVRKYADFHFYSEENIMLDNDYPDYEAHHREHKLLLFRLDDKLCELRKGDIGLHEIVQFLFEWFALHTIASDRKLANHVLKHNPP